jgi:hypothetical protein
MTPVWGSRTSPILVYLIKSLASSSEMTSNLALLMAALAAGEGCSERDSPATAARIMSHKLGALLLHRVFAKLNGTAQATMIVSRLAGTSEGPFYRTVYQ